MTQVSSYDSHELFVVAFEGKYRIDSLVLAFEQAISRKAARAGDHRLANEERVRLAVEALERESIMADTTSSS